MIRFCSFGVTLFFLAWYNSGGWGGPERTSQILVNAKSPVPEDARQLILVLTKSWEDPTGSLWFFERSEPGIEWKSAGESLPVVVGRSGLGWGRGLHPLMRRGPLKVEGDGRSPAGIFRIGAVFGYEPEESALKVQTDYIHTHNTVQCVDDPDSRHYNQILDSLSIGLVDWSSYEHMRRTDDLYRVGVVVEHNVAPVEPGAGSCIFLHIWSGPRIPTAGCTAMTATDMERLSTWIRKRDHPVLVQLPRPEYDQLREVWNLPDITTD